MKPTKIESNASLFGAAILAFGLGTLLSNYFNGYAALIIIFGALLHSLGMYKVHKKEKVSSFWQILYWLCWVILAVIVILTVL